MIYASMSQIENININFTRYIKIKSENRIRIERNIRVLRFKNKFIDRIKTFFICDIVFKNDIKQNEPDVKN